MSSAGTSTGSVGGAASPTTTPSSETTSSFKTADDVFNQATKDIDEGMEDEPVIDDDGNIVENSPDNTKIETKPEQLDNTELPLYVFQGKVMGKDQSLVIETQQQLDKIISQGQAAKQIIPEFKRLREENNVLRSKAERADNLDTLVTKDPKAFLDSIAENLDENVLADWVYDRFEEFKKLANMSDEERLRERKVKQADRLLREREMLAKESEAAQKRNEEAKINLEYKRLSNWRDDIQTKLRTKVDPTLHPWVDAQIKSVMISYNNTLKSGEEINLAKLNKMIDFTMAPLFERLSKKDMDKTVRNTLNEKSNTATRELQNHTRQQTTKPTNKTEPLTSDDIWNRIGSLVGAGKLRLEN